MAQLPCACGQDQTHWVLARRASAQAPAATPHRPQWARPQAQGPPPPRSPARPGGGARAGQVAAACPSAPPRREKPSPLQGEGRSQRPAAPEEEVSGARRWLAFWVVSCLLPVGVEAVPAFPAGLRIQEDGPGDGAKGLAASAGVSAVFSGQGGFWGPAGQRVEKRG